VPPAERDVVAIDGPAGSGKSTVARSLARRLGRDYLDTGAMYRVLCRVALEEDIPLDDEERLVERLSDLNLTMILREQGLEVRVNGRDCTRAIREPRVSDRVSRMATLEGVRRAMVEKQRNMVEKGNFVVEGRDIGTVVFPDARHKFYLDATLEERARRRYREIRDEKRGRVDRKEVLEDMRRRDERDRNRASSPLRPADDALIVDTTHRSIEEVVDYLREHVEST